MAGGYDSRRYRDAFAAKGMAPSPPVLISHDTTLRRQRHRSEIMFGRLKDWRRTATRYDRSAGTFFAAITLAAAIIFWLSQ